MNPLTLGRYLIDDFTAQDGYAVKAPEEIRIVEISPSGWVRVVWDVQARDQSWESWTTLEPKILERLLDAGPATQFVGGTGDPRYPSLTTHAPPRGPGQPW